MQKQSLHKSACLIHLGNLHSCGLMVECKHLNSGGWGSTLPLDPLVFGLGIYISLIIYFGVCITNGITWHIGWVL